MTTSFRSTSPAPEQLVTARWRSEVLAWSDTWPAAGVTMPSKKRRSTFRLLRALMGLADNSRADGSLKANGPDGTYWTLRQLADKMGMAKAPALDTLDWLKEEGWLAVKKGKPTAHGLGVDERRLIRPTVHESSLEANQPMVHEPNLEANPGLRKPRSTNVAARVHQSPRHGSSVEVNRELHPGSPGTPGRSTDKETDLNYEVKGNVSFFGEKSNLVNTDQCGEGAGNRPSPASITEIVHSARRPFVESPTSQNPVLERNGPDQAVSDVCPTPPAYVAQDRVLMADWLRKHPPAEGAA
jgi:hypothetical protein